MEHADGSGMTPRVGVLVDGAWRESVATRSFMAVSPLDDDILPGLYPISPWPELQALAGAATAGQAEMARLAMHEPARIGAFLRAIASELALAKAAIIAMAHRETALAAEPRLGTAEFGRTLLQLEQAAACCHAEQRCIDDARAGVRTTGQQASWRRPRSDDGANIHSMLEPLDGPVLVIGPNNFPLAYHGCVGGDAVAAFASGHAVIAKGHPLHPGTGVLLAECVHRAACSTAMPPGAFQFFCHAEPADIERLITHAVGAVAFTGSRRAGLSIKAVCDRIGVPAFLEMSSVNPVWLLATDAATVDACADAWMQSVTLGCGQFCTKPGLLFVPDAATAAHIAARLAPRFDTLDDAVLLGAQGAAEFIQGVQRITAAGAVLHSAQALQGSGAARVRPALCTAQASHALAGAGESRMLDEVFGPFGLVLSMEGATAESVYAVIGGQLTSCVWSGPMQQEHEVRRASAVVHRYCGRFLHNKMPTGVTVTEAIVHGGPFPATGSAAHTAVGFPTSLLRFAARRCYDGVDACYRPPLLG